MTDLVTDAAIDAATYAIGLAPEGSEKLPFILTVAAPLIAAAALRQAAETLDAFPKGDKHDEYIRGIAVAIVYLSSRADELEGK